MPTGILLLSAVLDQASGRSGQSLPELVSMAQFLSDVGSLIVRFWVDVLPQPYGLKWIITCSRDSLKK